LFYAETISQESRATSTSKATLDERSSKSHHRHIGAPIKFTLSQDENRVERDEAGEDEGEGEGQGARANLDSAEVHRVSDDLEIVRDVQRHGVHRIVEGPRIFMLPKLLDEAKRRREVGGHSSS